MKKNILEIKDKKIRKLAHNDVFEKKFMDERHFQYNYKIGYISLRSSSL